MKELIKEYSEAAELLLKLAEKVRQQAEKGQVDLLQMRRRHDQLMEMYADTCFAIAQMSESMGMEREEKADQKTAC